MKCVSGVWSVEVSMVDEVYEVYAESVVYDRVVYDVSIVYCEVYDASIVYEVHPCSIVCPCCMSGV